MRLRGRDDERVRVDRLLSGARTGRAGVLAYVGEPGIGKSALLAWARDRADGFSQLALTGVESESEIGYGGLLELFGAHRGLLEELPDPQARALSGALALSDHDVSALDVGAGVLSMLGLLSRQAPLLCTVDDAHWVDEATLTTLLFAVRRLADEPAAVLITARPPFASTLSSRGVSVAELGALDDGSARLVVGDCGVVDRQLTELVVRESDGNPLALVELSRPGRRDGTTGPSGLVASRFLGEVADLPEGTRRALVVVAACDTTDALRIEEGVRRWLGGVEALTPAYGTVLRSEPGVIRFRHPLLRAVVYDAASPSERRAAHRAVADAYPDRSDRRAWHRALAATGPDAEAAADLELTARAARRRGGFHAEALALERAARLSTTPSLAGRRYFAAAAAEFLAGGHARTSALLDRAGESDPTDPELAVDIAFERARLALWHDAVDRADLQEVARQVADRDPRRAARLLSFRIVGLLSDFDGPALAEAAAEVWSLMEGRPEPLDAAFKVALAWLGCGDTDRAIALAGECASLAAEQADPTTMVQVGHLFTWVERDGEAARVLEEGITLCRSSGGDWLLVNALCHRSDLHRRTGRLLLAVADAAAALDLAEYLQIPGARVEALATLAQAEALTGRLVEAQAHADQVLRLAAQMRLGSAESETAARSALASVALVQGRYAEAVVQLQQVRAVLDDGHFLELGACPSVVELVLAHAATGNGAEAIALAEIVEAFAAPRERRGLLATVALGRALVDAQDGAAFVRAIELAIDSPFAVGRARLMYGEWMRRTRRIVDARVELTAAHEVLHALGATAWADRAAAEMRVTGVRSGPRPPGSASLTPQELQIAMLAGSGHRNREIAGELFLSEKTVEAHLGRVFRKLGIRSRTQLALLLPMQEQP